MGIDKDLFFGTSHISFLCIKCEKVAIEPETSTCCGKLFCKDCFDESKKCPDEQCSEKPFKRQHLTPARQKEYFGLQLKCSTCDQKVTVEMLSEHKARCKPDEIDWKEKYREIIQKFFFLQERFNDLSHSNKILSEANKKLEEQIGILQNQNVQERHFQRVERQSPVQQWPRQQSPALNNSLKNGHNSRSSSRVKGDEIRQRSSSARSTIVISDLVFDYGRTTASTVIQKNLESAFVECKELGLKPYEVFKRVNQTMNQRYGGRWFSLNVDVFNRARANPKEGTECYYKFRGIDQVTYQGTPKEFNHKNKNK